MQRPRPRHRHSRFRQRFRAGLSAWLVRLFVIGFLGLNGVAYTGAYLATHYSVSDRPSLGMPKPLNTQTPSDFNLTYTTRRIAVSDQNQVHPNKQAKHWIETWQIPATRPRGTVLMFPGKGSSKSQLLLPAQAFHQLGYQSVLVDYQGVGGSSGSRSTIGIHEADDVAAVWAQAQQEFSPPFVLYGVSMGTAAILRAVANTTVADTQIVKTTIAPDAIILELPFTRLLNAISARLVPFHLPLAHLMIFWGGIQHGFNGFSHNPGEDAKAIRCPTLVFQGGKDRWTSQADFDLLMQHLGRHGQLVAFANAGHQLLITVDAERWRGAIADLLDRI